jgi:hypothetical protein
MGYRGWENYIPRNQAGTQPKQSKYRSQPTMVDGIRFDSKREAARYNLLKVRLRAGDIRGLKCQPRYYLCPLVVVGADPRDVNAGTPTTRRMFVAEYVADFEYEESDRGYGGVTWTLVVEDAKGAKTDVYKLKKRWFEAQYGIAIRET